MSSDLEPREEPLGTADRSVERHMLASGVAVEGHIHVVDPGPGHRDSFRDRTDDIAQRWTDGDGRTHRLALKIASGGLTLACAVLGHWSHWTGRCPGATSSMRVEEVPQPGARWGDHDSAWSSGPKPWPAALAPRQGPAPTGRWCSARRFCHLTQFVGAKWGAIIGRCRATRSATGSSELPIYLVSCGSWPHWAMTGSSIAWRGSGVRVPSAPPRNRRSEPLGESRRLGEIHGLDHNRPSEKYRPLLWKETAKK